MSDKTFYVETLFGARTQEPLVRISYGDRKHPREIAVISPEDATSLAMNLLQSSQASLTDAFLMSFLQDHVGVSLHEAAGVMGQFRQWRQGREVNDETDA